MTDADRELIARVRQLSWPVGRVEILGDLCDLAERLDVAVGRLDAVRRHVLQRSTRKDFTSLSAQTLAWELLHLLEGHPVPQPTLNPKAGCYKKEEFKLSPDFDAPLETE